MRRAGIVIMMALIGVVVDPFVWPAQADCSQADRIGGDCSEVRASNEGDSVTISRTDALAGSPGSSQASSSRDAGGEGAVQPDAIAPTPWVPPPPRMEAELGSAECGIKVTGLCRGQAPSKNPPAPTSAASAGSTQATPPSPPRYASELRGFRPRSPSIRVEPNGWSLPTLPTNMVALASSHTVRGTLLGWPVEVRFRPTRYHWTFGDGQTRSTSAAGATWQHLRAQQFDDTATAHRYARPGRYTVGLRVDYRAEFRFVDGYFREISGTVQARARSVQLDVLTVSPLLMGSAD